MRSGILAAICLLVGLVPGPLGAQQCGQLEVLDLRQELASPGHLELVDLMRCDVRDESPDPWEPVDREDRAHGCTVADATVLARAEQGLGPGLEPLCALESSAPCCATHEQVGCEELAVTACVCEQDARCCSGAWDATCAALACETACSGICVSTDVPQPNAGLDEEPGSPGCPAGMQSVDTFCIDRFEASLVEVGPPAVPWSPYFNPGSTRVRAVSVAGAVPQGYIDADQAEAACNEAGKRLCTDAEWLRACGGPGDLPYPYGSVRVPGHCNDSTALHPVIGYFGITDLLVFSMLDHPCINQVEPGLAPTGSFGLCITAESVLDLVGGLNEWTADPAGTFRGGSYVDSTLNGPGCLYRTTAHARSHWDYSTGFRCCADP